MKTYRTGFWSGWGCRKYFAGRLFWPDCGCVLGYSHHYRAAKPVVDSAAPNHLALP